MVVVLLGAYTRLADAGLGCPDWPGCYGQLTVPKTNHALAEAAVLYPDQPVEAAKAWKEMFHRYVAGSLGNLIFILAGLAWWRRRQGGSHSVLIPSVLVLLVLCQAALGMWTVTWRLHPLVVMGHLLGGMSVVTCLWLLVSEGYLADLTCHEQDLALRPWALTVLIVVIIQISLGGWTSANYASVVCSDFPTCHGHWVPNFNYLSEAFDFFRPIGANYEGGVMSLGARELLQMLHRYWGFFTYAVVMSWSVVLMLFARTPFFRVIGLTLMILSSFQVLLGVFNVILGLPMVVAVMHNGGAMLLLISSAVMVYLLSRGGASVSQTSP